MAKVKHIQCETLPAQLEANAIYFVRNTGEIVQTDSDGVPVKYSNNRTQVMSWGGMFYVSAGKYMVSNIDSGIRATSMSGISATSDIEALNNGYNTGYIAELTGKVVSLSGYVRIGVGMSLPVIVGVKRYDSSGSLISSEIVWKGNIAINNGEKWRINISSAVIVNEGDHVTLTIDARNLASNKQVRQFYTQIKLSNE